MRSAAKPKHLAPEYAAQFCDASVARAYVHRQPYTGAVYGVLDELLAGSPPLNVLELGCGLAEISRNLTARADQVDAVDPSSAMLAIAKMLPGGANPNLRWFCCAAEEFTFPGRYSLVVAAESLQWMDWSVVMPAIRRALAKDGTLALLNRLVAAPWRDELKAIVPLHSTNREYRPYELVEELTSRGFFELRGRTMTEPCSFVQPVDDYVESWHSRNGFSRERMDPAAAYEFDCRLREIIGRYASSECVTLDVQVEIAWGLPAASDT